MPLDPSYPDRHLVLARPSGYQDIQFYAFVHHALAGQSGTLGAGGLRFVGQAVRAGGALVNAPEGPSESGNRTKATLTDGPKAKKSRKRYKSSAFVQSDDEEAAKPPRPRPRPRGRKAKSSKSVDEGSGSDISMELPSEPEEDFAEELANLSDGSGTTIPELPTTGGWQRLEIAYVHSEDKADFNTAEVSSRNPLVTETRHSRNQARPDESDQSLFSLVPNHSPSVSGFSPAAGFFGVVRRRQCSRAPRPQRGRVDAPRKVGTSRTRTSSEFSSVTVPIMRLTVFLQAFEIPSIFSFLAEDLRIHPPIIQFINDLAQPKKMLPDMCELRERGGFTKLFERVLDGIAAASVAALDRLSRPDFILAAPLSSAVFPLLRMVSVLMKSRTVRVVSTIPDPSTLEAQALHVRLANTLAIVARVRYIVGMTHAACAHQLKANPPRLVAKIWEQLQALLRETTGWLTPREVSQ